MPVDQTGETILFVVDDGFIEAHIRLEYDPKGAAERFAWLVPVAAIPELSVGSESLLSSLDLATVPLYGFTTNNEPCPDVDGDVDPCDEDDGGRGEKLDVGDEGPPSEPDVVSHETVGAFEMFVLDGGDAQGVMQWLGDNGFAQDPAAEPIIAEYLDEGHLFVAFKLAPDADASEIHPITLRYAGEQPCVPIRLTRIAAVEDMAIRTYFLGDARVVPSNYRHVVLNPLKLDFTNFAANYREVVTQAVDEAGGRAWVTEFAGDSAVVSPQGIVEADWSADVLATATAMEAVAAATTLGNVDCSGPACVWNSPLLAGILAEHLHLPEDFDLDALWVCPECFEDTLAAVPWDPRAFVSDVATRIIEPAKHGVALLARFPVLTRMTTTLSPHEMLEDPMFQENPDMPDVFRGQELGVLNSFCSGERSFSVPDGRLVALPGASWPDIEPELMPYAARIEEIAAAGAPMVIVDNEVRIDALLTRFNETNNVRVPLDVACGGDTGEPSGSGGLLGGPTHVESADGGCACAATATPRRLGWGWSLLALGLLWWPRRRVFNLGG